jgi:hypothetical protein
VDKSVFKASVLVVLIVALMYGQATTSLTGTVNDPTGAVIPNAKVELVNQETGVQRTATSDNTGTYSFLQVIPGTYRVTATAAGFRTAVVSDVRLLVNTPGTLPIKMDVGEISESVEVKASAVLVNTTDASIGNAVGTNSIVELPLNARNIAGLLAQQPGVTTTSEGDTDSRNGAVNGGKSDQGNVTLDGVDVNDQVNRNAFTSVLRMTPDSVQEFRVVTLNANADSGRTSGAQITLVTRGGTNDLHGALYEYHRNTITTANSFFNNMYNVPREKLIRNIFGAAAGGPIKKNRLFLFGNYEGRRDAKDGTAERAVPSMALRQGIVQYYRKDGTLAQVTPTDIANKLDPRGVNQAVLKVLQSYPEPNSSGTADGLNVLGYRFTAPTPLRWNTYITRLDYNVDENSRNTVFFRGNLQNDHSSSMPQFPGQQPNSVSLANNKGFAVGWTSLITNSLISNFRYGYTRQGYESTGISNISAVSLRGLDNPIGITRGRVNIIPVHTISDDINWTKRTHTLQFGAVARIIRNNRNSLANSFSSASANASWLVSSGAELNAPFPDMSSGSLLWFRYAMNDVMGLVTQGNAQYNYRTDGSVIGEGNPVKRVFGAEEYEMYVQDTWRAMPGLTITAGLRYSLMPPIYEVNGQQVSPSTPIGDWFDMRGGLAQQGKSQMQAGRISFIPVDQPGGRPLYPYHKKNFAPRLAVAYSPQGDSGLSRFFFGERGKSVVRAGFGMYYDLFGSALMQSYDATAFGLSSSLTNPSATLTVATAPRYTAIGQIPPSILLPAPPATFPAVYPDSFAITNGLDDTIVPPYNMNANLSIAREFKGGWNVEIGYVGRYSRRSLVRRDAAMPTDLVDPKSGMDYFTAATILAQQVRAGVPWANVQPVPFWENLWSKSATSTMTATQVAYRRFAASPEDWTYGLYQLDTAQGGCVANNRCSDLGPYAIFSPQFSYLSVFSSVGGGNYHGLQVTVKKAFAGGETLTANYTFSKSIDLRSNTERASTSSGVLWNPWNPGLMKGVSDYDQTHLFNLMGAYALPFGKGKRFASKAGGVLNAIVGGWQIAGIARMATSMPTSVYETGVWPTNWNNNNWAQWTGTPIDVKRNNNAPASFGGGPNMFPNPDAASQAFAYVMPGQIGMRNGLRGDSAFNIDTNLSKRFVMPWKDGKHSIQFRWETFNLTNSARFDAGGASLDISGTGTFGKYTNQFGDPRVMQFGLRYEF